METPSPVMGRGGIPDPLSDNGAQVAAGRASLVDQSPLLMNTCFFNSNGQDAWTVLEAKTFGHEMGHALGLFHGDGLDDDRDGLIDEDLVVSRSR